MKLFSKDRNVSELNETIRGRAIQIIEDNIDNSVKSHDTARLKIVRNEIRINAPAIDSGRATLPDVVAFCNEYGCSADFLLGLDERMYR